MKKKRDGEFHHSSSTVLAGNNIILLAPIRRRLMKTSLLSWRWMAPCAQATKMVMALLRPHTTHSIRERRRQRGQGVVDSKCARGPPVRWALPRCTRDPVRHKLACHTTTRDSMPRTIYTRRFIIKPSSHPFRAHKYMSKWPTNHNLTIRDTSQ